MKKAIRFFFQIVILTMFLSSTVSYVLAQTQPCIYASMINEESCYPGGNGRAKVFIAPELNGKCTVEWYGVNGFTSSAETIYDLSAGEYYVTVRSNTDNHVLYQGSVSVTREVCKVEVHITGPSQVEGGCNVIPKTHYEAYVAGGTPPYTFPDGWFIINENRASFEYSLVEGRNILNCCVHDSEYREACANFEIFAKKMECAQDPNEIKGPEGFGDSLRFVNGTDKMRYNIDFENDPDFATAPASRVKITYDVPAHQNISSFRLSDFGFGNFIYTVPSNATSYTKRLDVSDSLGVWVDVTAGIDILNHQLFWIFQSIDPATGAEPSSSQMGFLPINDSLGRGEGYVSFSIAPTADVYTGDTVAAEASIVFDDNAPIGTNVWKNTFDVVAPTSTLHVDMNATDSLYCNFSFDAQDDPNGSGVRSVEVYVSINDADYVPIGSANPDSTLSYSFENGVLYRFMSIATDNVGNREAFKALADTTVNYNAAPVDLFLSGNMFNEYDPVNTYIGTFYTLDNDVNLPFVYELVNGTGDTDNGLFKIESNTLRTNVPFVCNRQSEYTIRVRTTDIGGLSFEKSFLIHEILRPNITETNIRQELCQGDSLLFNGHYLSEAGLYSDTLATVNGCDSIVNLYLVLNPTYDLSISQEICQGDTFDFHGSLLTETGVYRDTLQTRRGCDSIVTLTLIVHLTYSITVGQEICQGDSYNFNGKILTESGMYMDSLQTEQGCDSIITLSLTVNPVFTTPISYVMCQGESYDFSGEVLAESGIYYDTLQSVNGCDSIIILDLTVNPVYNVSIVEDICQGGGYEFYGQTLTATGTYTHTFQTVDGCDSVISLMLTVNQPSVTHLEANICEGDSYPFFDTVLTSSGEYIRTVQSATGCDSVVVVLLTVNQSTTGDTTVVACNNFTWYGNTYTQSGDFTHTLTNVSGCDSIVTLHLTVNTEYHETVNVSVCDTYVWNGEIYSASGNYDQTYTAADGCDSIVTLHLTVNYSTTEDTIATACDSFVWHGTTYTESGEYPLTLTNANGCDSVVTLHLTINHPVFTAVTATACESFLWNGTTYTQSGTYTYSHPDANGCTQVDTMHLTINNPVHTTVTEIVCESFVWNGVTYTQSGTYTYSHPDANGCTQVDTLHLTIHHPVHTAVTETACESFLWNGVTYTQSGTYTFSHLDANGCTQEDTLHLTIHNPVHTAVTETACESFVWNGITYTQSGTYTFSHPDANGCTQVDTLYLIIHNPVHTAVTETACSSFLWNGTLYTQSGTYTFSHLDANGCTQVDTLHLTIHNPVHTAVTETACESFTWNGITYTQSGTYTHGHLDANGCTQVDTLHLIIHNPVHIAVTETACESFSWNGITYTQSGTYTYSHLDANGCTQVDTLHLTINNPVHTAVTETACSSFLWNGTLYTQSGTYTFSHLDANGCTQVDTLHLTIYNPLHTAVTETACESFVWNNITYTQSGTYTHGHLDANGCTQVDTLHLIINQSTTGDTSAVACDSFTWNGNTYTESGDYTSYLTNVAGCDSVVTLHLTINFSNAVDTTVFACESFTWNGTTYTESGDYTTNQTNAAGCDSVVTLHLTIADAPALQAISGETEICLNQFATYTYDISEPDYQYRWFKDNALWAENVPQVTLHEMGEGSVLLTMSVADEQNGCAADTSLLVQVVSRIAPDTTEIRRKGSTNILICQPVTSDYGEVHYRWGYTNRFTYNEATMPGDHNYCLYDFGIDTMSYLYWVETYLNNPIGEGCDNRSYYGHSVLTSTSDYDANTVEAYMSRDHIMLYVSALSPENVSASLYDVNGKLLLTRGYGIADVVSDAIAVNIAPGVYFLRVNVGNEFYSFKLLKL